MRRVRVLLFFSLGAGVFIEAPARAQGYSPSVAAGRMTVAEGLEVRLFASEPMIRQPVAIEFDDRGRLWVIQYLQYPNPSGLRRVKVDRYSRTVYDQVPPPPPHGPRGNDRVTILEDTDADGKADRSRDFVAGLNLASGLAFGRGGVFILQAPYLLFYPDGDRDDRPDGDPEVLLSGFGMEDAHSVANSLTWGPDGWLYGLQGSTVTARVRGIEFQQGVWRYHPRTRRFELFCEGGGNMWGLDFDPRGRLFASTNVGGFVMLHGVQGGYYWKSFGKHGPLHNPYAFGYFDHVRHDGLRGGHVAAGGLFYEADTWPAEWRGRYVAADLLGHAVRGHEVTPLGTTFRARQAADVLRANDTWFAPCDVTLGPDGALYVADWHDRRTAHPDPDADWDRSNGRVYRITAPGAKPVAVCDLAASTDRELASLLEHPNVWYRRKARRLLSERPSSGVSDRLRDEVVEGRGPRALEALWASYGCSGLDETRALRLLEHPDADIRAWIIRLMGDEPSISPRVEARIVELAGREPDASVRAQLACTARRMSSASGLDVAQRLLLRDLDGADPHIPLLLWWAVEHHAPADVDGTLRRLATPEGWRSGLVRTTVLPRLIRRFAAERNPSADADCAHLLASAPSAEARGTLLAALEESTRGRPVSTFSSELPRAVIAMAERDPDDATLTQIAARLGDRSAIGRVRRLAADPGMPSEGRITMLEVLGDLGDRSSLDPILEMSVRDPSLDVRLAALAILGRFDDGRIATAVLSAYPGQVDGWKVRARELLLSRAAWAGAYLSAVDRGELPAKDLSLDQLSRFPTLKAPALAPLVRKHWGLTRGPTSEDRLAEVRRLNNDLRAGPGDAVQGRLLFREKCATCHRLGGEGSAIGPDLTFANRQDRDFLLTSLVDPAGAVRKEYQLFQVETRDGRVLSGLIVEQTPDAVTLCDARGLKSRIARAEVAELKESDASLMPESLYREFRPDQLRDLFSFLQTMPLEGRKDQP